MKLLTTQRGSRLVNGGGLSYPQGRFRDRKERVYEPTLTLSGRAHQVAMALMMMVVVREHRER